jgi:hypothetical protein
MTAPTAMKAAACTAARAALWLLAFWTFVWSCFLLMEYVSGHPAMDLMHDSVDELTCLRSAKSRRTCMYLELADSSRGFELIKAPGTVTHPQCLIRIGSSRPKVAGRTPASCMTAHK